MKKYKIRLPLLDDVEAEILIVDMQFEDVKGKYHLNEYWIEDGSDIGHYYADNFEEAKYRLYKHQRSRVAELEDKLYQAKAILARVYYLTEEDVNRIMSNV